MALAREGGLGLGLEEMKKIQTYFEKRGREPTEVEIESIVQSWSEHCSYKSSKSVMKRTFLSHKTPLSVISEDAGVVEFDDEHYYAAALESHNHPSALDPYGGAATGVGGIVRDVLCMGAKPISLTDMLFFGLIDSKSVTKGIKHPSFLARGVVKGIADYGNRIGVPTVSGMISFNDSYTGNCLVNVGCIGIMRKEDLTRSRAGKEGDLLILAGGKTGRDGIHGVTFASEELREDSDSTGRPAVQLGDPLMEEALIHACLECVQEKLLTGMKDLGGGGLSSCVCEMVHSSDLGAEIEIERVPLREGGMEPWEIWVSESQERMLLAVKPVCIERVLEIFNLWEMDAVVIGKVIAEKKIRISKNGEKLCDLDLGFLLNVPYKWKEVRQEVCVGDEIDFREPEDIKSVLLRVLSSPEIGGKEFAIRQYDHTVKGNTILQPLQGIFDMKGPGDAAVLRPVENSLRGLAVSCDCNPYYFDLDPYKGTLSGVEESFRNIIAVGSEPHTMLDCLNFGNPEDETIMRSFHTVCRALSDAVSITGVPVISGNVSFYNESPAGAIIPTPVIMSIGIIDNVKHSISVDAKGGHLYLIGRTENEFGGSEYLRTLGLGGRRVPGVDFERFARNRKALSNCFGYINSCHDVSNGGIGVALSEMLFSGGMGADVSLESIYGGCTRFDKRLFSESNGRWIVEVEDPDGFEASMKSDGAEFSRIGKTREDRRLTIDGKVDVDIDELYEAWRDRLGKQME